MICPGDQGDMAGQIGVRHGTTGYRPSTELTARMSSALETMPDLGETIRRGIV